MSKLTRDQLAMRKYIRRFKEYVATYPEKSNLSQGKLSFVFDMIYGIGIAIDPHEFEFGDGYGKFREYLKEIL